jgi:ribonuclease HI
MSETYYVVKKGYQTGIFKTWNECKRAVDGFSGPVFKKFDSFKAACEFFNSPIRESKSTEIFKAQQSKPSSNSNKIDSDNGKLDNRQLESVCNNEEKLQLEKIKQMVKNIKSSQFSEDFNYNVALWNTIDDDIYIFTDGSSRRSQEYFNSGIGVYLGYNCTNIKEQYHDKTNNMCELLAVDYAFKLIIKYFRELSEIKKVIKIVSDSEYTIKACSLWLPQWKKNNWKTKTGEDVKNRDLIESIDGSMSRIKLINSKLDDTYKIRVKFIHVNSHQKPDMTDKLKYSIWFGNYVADGLSQNSI